MTLGRIQSYGSKILLQNGNVGASCCISTCFMHCANVPFSAIVCHTLKTIAVLHIVKAEQLWLVFNILSSKVSHCYVNKKL